MAIFPTLNESTGDLQRSLRKLFGDCCSSMFYSEDAHPYAQLYGHIAERKQRLLLLLLVFVSPAPILPEITPV